MWTKKLKRKNENRTVKLKIQQSPEMIRETRSQNQICTRQLRSRQSVQKGSQSNSHAKMIPDRPRIRKCTSFSRSERALHWWGTTYLRCTRSPSNSPTLLSNNLHGQLVTIHSISLLLSFVMLKAAGVLLLLSPAMVCARWSLQEEPVGAVQASGALIMLMKFASWPDGTGN